MRAAFKPIITSLAVDENVLWLDVTMDDASTMKVFQPQCTLVEYAAQLMFVDSSAGTCVQLEQVFLHVLEDHSNVAMPLNDFLELDDIWMV